MRAPEPGRAAPESLTGAPGVSENPLGRILARGGLAVLDGGLATALEARGHVLDTDLWSARLLLDDPDEIRATHRSYLEAGADCITTVSYQASFEGFARLGLDEAAAEELLRGSVRLAVEARATLATGPRSPAPLVAASVGPYGAYLADGSEYDGRYGVGRSLLEAFHRRRFEVLASAGADVLACETIPSHLEAEVLLGILDSLPGAWAWFSFSCADAVHLHDGTPLVDAVRACARHPRVAAVGVNCTAPRFVAGLLRAARGVTDLPLIAYPNSGEAYDAASGSWSGATAEDDWLAGVDEWVAAGARLVGGCCRIGPDLIGELRARVDSGRFADPRA